MVALNLRDLRARRNDRGAELIELALVLPILLLVIAAIVDFGFLFQRWEVVTNAAREGARIAILPGYTDADVTQRIRDYLDASGLDGDAATIPAVVDGTITLDSGATVETKTVVVQYNSPFSFLGPIAGLVGGGGFTSINLKAASVMRVE